MKRTVMVTIEKEIDISISDELLTPEALELFSSSIYPIDKPDDLFEHAAVQLARYGAHFVEGVGLLLEGNRFWVTADSTEAYVLEINHAE